MHRLFVYGSLKQGFPNFHVNRGRRVDGDYLTAEPHPLFLFGGHLPCLLPQPGSGLHVRGQLFAVDDDALAAMDRLERVGEPGGYRRGTIVVVRDGAEPAAPSISAFVYLQQPEFLARGGPHEGPIAEYTPAMATRLRW